MNRRRVITSVAVLATVGAAAALQRDLRLTADQVGARIKRETWVVSSGGSGTYALSITTP